MNPRSRNLLVAAAVLVVALAIAAVAFAGGGDDDSDVASGGATGTASGPTLQQYQAVDITGTPLGQFASSADDPAIGKAVPELTGHSFDGTAVHIRNDGRPKLVLFLAHWCPHCRAEVPVVRDWLDAGNGTNLDVYAVSTNATADRPNWPPSKWLEDENWPTPVLVDDRQSVAASAYGLTSFPYFVFVNSDGTVALRGSGEVPAAELTQMASRVK
jgi:thiol-disulfide isomerase/thioredoxin